MDDPSNNSFAGQVIRIVTDEDRARNIAPDDEVLLLEETVKRIRRIHRFKPNTTENEDKENSVIDGKPRLPLPELKEAQYSPIRAPRTSTPISFEEVPENDVDNMATATTPTAKRQVIAPVGRNLVWKRKREGSKGPASPIANDENVKPRPQTKRKLGLEGVGQPRISTISKMANRLTWQNKTTLNENMAHAHSISTVMVQPRKVSLNLPEEIHVNGAVYRKSDSGAENQLRTNNYNVGITVKVTNEYAMERALEKPVDPTCFAQDNFPNMQPFGPPGMISREPPGSRFDHSRLGFGYRRFRYPNSGNGFRPSMMMESPPHAMPFAPFVGQPRPPPPFIPLQRPQFGPHFYQSDQMNDFNQERFNNHGRHCGPVSFRPQRYAPYPRPDMVRRNCDEVNSLLQQPPKSVIPIWRPPFRPEISSCFSAPPCETQREPAISPLPDWRPNYNNGYFPDSPCENFRASGVSRHFENYSSPLNGPRRRSLFSSPLSEIQQPQQLHGQGRNSQCQVYGPRNDDGDDCCFTEGEGQDEPGPAPAEEEYFVPRHDTDNALPEHEQPYPEANSSDNELSDVSPNIHNNCPRENKVNSDDETKQILQKSKHDLQPSPELEKAIKLFIERHVPPASLVEVPEVRDNFYYVGDFLQISIYGNCSSRLIRGLQSPVASYGICFKKGNHLNCAGHLKPDYPQTPMAAELLAAERAILIAKHKVRTDRVTIITESSYLVNSVEQWKERISSRNNLLMPETWMEVKHVNEIQRLCKVLDDMKVKWTLGDLRDTQFKELQIAKNLSVQCDDVIQDFINI